MIRTSICAQLNIEYPIFQGGMAYLATAQLAAAVSEAGALGIIGAGNAPADWVRDQIRQVRARTDRPFGVNLLLVSPYAPEIARVIIEEDVPVVTTGAGNPGPYIAAWKEAGIKVIPVVSSVALAKRLVRQGADALVAEGTESGGHVGETTTMALVPQVVDAVEVPVIAAGGIADGRGFVAALALGAQGVQLGTRFVCSTECIAHSSYKEMICQAKDRDTAVTGRPTGHPVRALRNQLTREFERLEAANATAEELERLGTGRYRAACLDGDITHGTVLAGQIAGMISDIRPVREIIAGLMAEAETTLANLRRYPI
ncbi:MAG: enoyl-[acyl-carrier-protein] reductase FabK [Bacillota bacterium]